MTRSSKSPRGRIEIAYRYDATTFNRPILEITRSIDTDMDGITDLFEENAVLRTRSARHTGMGNHVATLEDVLA